MHNFKFSKTVEVRYNDLDTMRHVNNAVYLTYIEHARAAYLTNVCQWDWNSMSIVLAKTDINYRKPIHFHHNPAVWIRTSKMGQSSITQEVLITEKDRRDIIFAEASVVLVHIDYKTGRPLPLPDYIRSRINSYESVKIER